MPEACSASLLPGMVSTARQHIATVVEQRPMARDTWRLRLHCPEIARQSVPGQFFMIRQPGVTNPLLGRPFALYDTYLDAAGAPAGIDVVYLVVGKMTGLMSSWRAGDHAEIWGPLGNGFPLPRCLRLILVAGGIGNTPFLAAAREAIGGRTYSTSRSIAPLDPAAVTFCYGVRSAGYLAGLADFQSLQIDLRLATDDGSCGHHGFVTDLVAEILVREAPAGAARGDDAVSRTQHGDAAPRVPLAIYCCGPEPMMHAVAELAARHRVPCWLSLETPMACGFGACFSCVARVKQPDGGWDYRRVCVEGPVFPAAELAW